MSLVSALRRAGPPVPSLEGRLCLVTGAASGIGRATALAAGRAGARLVLTDIDAAGLDAVAGDLGDAAVSHRALDVADFEAVRTFAEEIHSAHGSLDVVANVAGISTWGAVERLTHEQWRRTIQVDLLGPVHVIETFVPEMVHAGRGGQLVNVSSAAGLFGFPWHAPYSAAKFGLRGISEVLRFDLRRHGIGVTLVCPGGVDTPMVETLEIAGVDRAALQASRWPDRFRRHAKTSDQVAERILDAVVRNRYLVYTSNDIRVLHLLERCVPSAYRVAMRLANDRLVTVLEKRLALSEDAGGHPARHGP
jgi:NAD(P)-dependent dehydrogenase (short-subunit alcohol dehydrogenase family)